MTLKYRLTEKNQSSRSCVVFILAGLLSSGAILPSLGAMENQQQNLQQIGNNNENAMKLEKDIAEQAIRLRELYKSQPTEQDFEHIMTQLRERMEAILIGKDTSYKNLTDQQKFRFQTAQAALDLLSAKNPSQVGYASLNVQETSQQYKDKIIQGSPPLWETFCLVYWRLTDLTKQGYFDELMSKFGKILEESIQKKFKPIDDRIADLANQKQLAEVNKNFQQSQKIDADIFQLQKKKWEIILDCVKNNQIPIKTEEVKVKQAYNKWLTQQKGFGAFAYHPEPSDAFFELIITQLFDMMRAHTTDGASVQVQVGNNLQEGGYIQKYQNQLKSQLRLMIENDPSVSHKPSCTLGAYGRIMTILAGVDQFGIDATGIPDLECFGGGQQRRLQSLQQPQQQSAVVQQQQQPPIQQQQQQPLSWSWNTNINQSENILSLMRHIQTNNLTPDQIDLILNSLNQQLSSVKSLHLYQIGPDSAKVLAQILRYLNKLEELSLWDNQIGDEGAIELAKGIETLTNLKNLDLSTNQIGAEGAIELAKGIKDLTNLKGLSLLNNQIGDVGAKALSEVLLQLKNLEELYLSKNQIGPVGAKALAKGIKNRMNLKSLDLSNNRIGPEGAIELGQVLPSLTNLQYLELPYNNIDDQGAKKLAEGIKNLKKLRGLHLSNNQIGEDGKKALDSAKQNHPNQNSLRIEYEF